MLACAAEEIEPRRESKRRVSSKRSFRSFPDPDEGLEIAPEIWERLLRSLDTPQEELLSSEQFWAKAGL